MPFLRLIGCDTSLPQPIECCVAVQRVVTALALLAGDAPLVSDLRQLSRALVSPAEQFGKQIEGVAGCRASGRSGAIAGALGVPGELLAQAVGSRSSGSSIDARLITFLSCIFGIPLLLASDTLTLVALPDQIANPPGLRFHCD
ncbi:hypothetical protein BCO18442_03760 [Burkholderia contaminans]|nr:hypothetical protein BCO18442_03760 [Burkholderia contaminans]